MRVLIKTFTGKSFMVECEHNDTIMMLKQKIGMIQGFSLENQKLYFAGKELNESARTLSSYNIQLESTINWDTRFFCY